MQARRRVVITGIGAICGMGDRVSSIWKNVIDGKSAIQPFDQSNFPAAVKFKHAAVIQDFNATHYFEGRQAKILDRFSQLGLIAAKEATGQANISWDDTNAYQSGVVTGSSIGGVESHDFLFEELYLNGKNRLHPLTIPKAMPSALTSHICAEFGIKGPSYTISTACSSGNHAIGNAFWMIRNGVCDAMLTGASETPIFYGFLKSWEAIRVIAPDTCRPFSANRKGMILGEGGAILVLESLENAQRRGANIYAEIVGFGMSSDATHITKPDQVGAENAMRSALKDAEVAAEEIDYINAHGTGTRVNDEMEIAAIKAVFGCHATNLAISSTKSMHGHLLGGASALEAVITTLAVQQDLLPPTINFEEEDPACDLDIVPNSSRKKTIQYALSNSFAFGGLNAVLVFKKYT